MKRIAIILSIVALATALFAQPGPFKGSRPGADQDMDRPFYRMRGLDLTDEQKARIDKMHLDLQKELLPLRSQLETLHDEYRLLVIDDKATDSAIRKNMEKRNELRTKIHLARTNHVREIRSLLTDEQKTQFDNHFLTRENRRGKGVCRDGDRGPRPQRRFRDPIDN